MKKIIWLLVLSLLVSLCGCSIELNQNNTTSPGEPEKPTVSDIPESPIEDFTYEMKNGEVIITSYIGTARKIRIPAEINERPVTTIGEKAFKGYDLTDIYIPESVTLIAWYAFGECKCLEIIVFPASLTEIGEYAFRSCEALKTVRLPENLTKLGECAFFECTSLKEIYLPGSLTTIGASAFSHCRSLEKIHFSEGLKTIGSSAFKECTKLAAVDFPDGLSRIEDDAFELCRSLSAIAFPDSLKVIGYGAFNNCDSLATVDLPEGVTELENCAFENCDSLRFLRIPAGTFTNMRLESIKYQGNTTFTVYTPVGYSRWTDGYTEFIPFVTTLIVKNGSIAHKQAIEYQEYVQFEVE